MQSSSALSSARRACTNICLEPTQLVPKNRGQLQAAICIADEVLPIFQMKGSELTVLIMTAT